MSDGPWACAQCTFVNEASATRCSMCSDLKPRPKPGSKKKKKKKQQLQPQQQRPQGGAVRGQDDELLAQVEAMGLGHDRASIIDALHQAGNNAERAVALLLDSPAPPQQQPATQAGSKPSKACSGKRGSGKEKQGGKKPSGAAAKSVSAPAPASASAAGASSSSSRSAREAERLKEERKRQRKQLEEESNARLRAAEEEALAQRQAMAREAKRRKEENERARLEERAQQEKERLESARLEEEQRRQRREEQEAAFDGIESALQHVKQSYAVSRFQDMCRMLSKIARNIIKHPGDPKFHKVNVTSAKIDRAIVRPLGGMYVLKQLGFEVQNTPDGPRAVLQGEPDPRRLKDAAALFDSFLGRASSQIPGIMKAHPAGDEELAFFALQELCDIFDSVLVGRVSGDFRRIDMTTRTFASVLLPVPFSLPVLHAFGFEPSSGNPDFLVVDAPDFGRFETGLIDLREEVAKRAPYTPVVVAVSRLRQHNPADVAARFLEAVNKCMLKVVEAPHERKFHRIKLGPLYHKLKLDDEFGSPSALRVKGGDKFFGFFGFELSDEERVVEIEYPFNERILFRRQEQLAKCLALE